MGLFGKKSKPDPETVAEVLGGVYKALGELEHIYEINIVDAGEARDEAKELRAKATLCDQVADDHEKEASHAGEALKNFQKLLAAEK